MGDKDVGRVQAPDLCVRFFVRHTIYITTELYMQPAKTCAYLAVVIIDLERLGGYGVSLTVYAGAR